MSKAVAQGAANRPARAPRRRLFRRYALWFFLLIAGAFLVSGAIEVYFSYQEHKQLLVRVQQEKAAGAAALVSQFIGEIKAQVGWTLHAAFVPGEAGTEQRRFDFIRLLRQVPAVTELSYLDGEGRVQLRVSRLSIDMEGSNEDLSQEPKFIQARESSLYLSPVYFHKGSEPHLTMALADAGRSPGVTAAEVNLKLIWDLISRMHVGEAGRAYVVDADNRLIAHPDVSLVLRKIDLSNLPHVRAARAAANSGAAADEGNVISRDPEGREVLSAHAFIAPLDWIVFVDLPVREALAPVFASLQRTAALVLLSIGLTVLIGLALGRHMTGPIRLLREGAAHIGGGDLTQRIEVNTGDELEDLADEFNEMTAKLRQSYDNVERVSALKRYFSPQLAELIISSDEEGLTESHRREITVLFCDLRKFTEFSSIAEPEEAMRVLEQYYVALGRQLREFEATIGHFAGDGLMAFFNDPLPCPDHAAQAVKMAVVMREDVDQLLEGWSKRGLDLGFGIGIATGYATLGHIGTEDQFHYTAIGSVVNLASRLCDEAKSGEILISETVHAETENLVRVELEGERLLKGLPKAVPILKMVGLEQMDG